MRHNQNRRSRGRSRKGPNPLSRSYESNGPDVKVRGNAAHVADKYMSLARDAHASGDPIAAENYLQHAEHYNRIVMAAQTQFQQSQPQFRDNSEEGYDDDRQMNGRSVRDRFDYNSDEEEGEDRGEGGEQEGDRGFRPPEHQQHQRADDRGDRQRGPRDRFQYRDRNDRNDRGDRGRYNRDDRYDRDSRPERDERSAQADREMPAEASQAEPPQPVAEAGAPPPRRRRGRPRNDNGEGEGENISDGAAALAAFPD
jgi:hypothetical protein